MEKLEGFIIEKINSEHILLALIPMMATFLSFVFQFVYLRYFGVSFAFIDLDLNKVIVSVFVIVALSYMFLKVFYWALKVVRSSRYLFYRCCGFSLISFLISSPFVYLGWKFGLYWQTIVLAVASVLMGLYLFFERWLDESKSNRGQSKSNKGVSGEQGGLFDSVEFFVIYSVVFVAAFGLYFASSIKEYEYLKDNPDALFVTKMGESYVFTLVDPETSVFGRDILVVNASEKIELVKIDRKVKSYWVLSSEK